MSTTMPAPGTWCLDGAKIGRIVCGDHPSQIVCDVYTTIPWATAQERTADVRARQHLIVAAPDLYGAAAEFDEWFDAAVQHDFDAYHVGGLRQAWLKTQAAMRKAEGS